jgi:hypothetical protein
MLLLECGEHITARTCTLIKKKGYCWFSKKRAPVQTEDYPSVTDFYFSFRIKVLLLSHMTKIPTLTKGRTRCALYVSIFGSESREIEMTTYREIGKGFSLLPVNTQVCATSEFVTKPFQNVPVYH